MHKKQVDVIGVQPFQTLFEPGRKIATSSRGKFGYQKILLTGMGIAGEPATDALFAAASAVALRCIPVVDPPINAPKLLVIAMIPNIFPRSVFSANSPAKMFTKVNPIPPKNQVVPVNIVSCQMFVALPISHTEKTHIRPAMNRILFLFWYVISALCNEC